MGDLRNLTSGISLLGDASSPVTLTATYNSGDSGVLNISKARYVVLGVNYTMGSGETSNSIQLQYDVATSVKATITATTLAFVDSDPDTITDSGNGFLTGGFSPGQVIIVKNSASNDGGYNIDTAVAGTLTLDSADALTTEAAGANVTIEATSGPFYRLQTESISSGAVTRSNREDTFAAAAAAGAYDRFSVILENVAGWDFLRVWAQESGVASNFGSTWIEASTLGR